MKENEEKTLISPCKTLSDLVQNEKQGVRWLSG